MTQKATFEMEHVSQGIWPNHRQWRLIGISPSQTDALNIESMELFYLTGSGKVALCISSLGMHIL